MVVLKARWSEPRVVRDVIKLFHKSYSPGMNVPPGKVKSVQPRTCGRLLRDGPATAPSPHHKHEPNPSCMSSAEESQEPTLTQLDAQFDQARPHHDRLTWQYTCRSNLKRILPIVEGEQPQNRLPLYLSQEIKTECCAVIVRLSRSFQFKRAMRFARRKRPRYSGAIRVLMEERPS